MGEMVMERMGEAGKVLRLIQIIYNQNNYGIITIEKQLQSFDE